MSSATTERPSQPCLLRGLDHITVLSADFDRSRRFYCALLGMRAGPRPAIAVPGLWLYVGDHPVLHVLPRTTVATVGCASPAEVDADPGRPRAIDHFALNAEDRPAFEQRLTDAGQPFESRRLADTETWQIFLTDPDGARVELSFPGAETRASGPGSSSTPHAQRRLAP